MSIELLAVVPDGQWMSYVASTGLFIITSVQS